MTTLPYSGYAARAAHFASRPPPPGLNPDHTTPNPEPDPFNPQPTVPANQAGDVWDVEEFAPLTNQPNLAQVPVTHWYPGQNAVPSGVPYARAQQAMQERLMVDHSDTNYVPDSVRLYQHVSEGQANLFTVGRMPQNAGESLPDGVAYLANGKNSYDQTNLPNEVYQGDAANVGRYRLGVKTTMWGLYDYPLGRFGQDANLRAYTGLSPAFPTDKPHMDDTAPYTPNSTGTAHWAPAASNNVPSLFGLPSETALTDYTQAAGNVVNTDFEDRSGGF